MKKQTLTGAKKKAWDAFSAYIRTRDCKEYSKRHPESNNGLEAPCVTCRRVYPLKALQAGHFIAGRRTSQLFDEIAVNSQCYGCNIGRKGATDEYWIYMENRYGRKEIDRIMAQKNEILKLKIFDYQDLEQKYKKKKEAL